MVSMMENFKMYIFLLVKTQVWPPWALPEKALHWGLDSFFSLPLAPCPSLKGKLKMSRAGGGRKTPRGKSVGGKEGGAAGKWQEPSKQKEVSLPRGLLPRASLGPPLQFCSAWHSFPVESRSGPPSPHIVRKQASPFSSLPWGLTFTGREEAPKGPNTKKAPLLVEGRTKPDPSLQFHCDSHQRPKAGPKTSLPRPTACCTNRERKESWGGAANWQRASYGQGL